MLFSGVSSAELTQQEVEDAVYNALISAPISFNGGALNTVPWLYPSFSGFTLGEWLMNASGYGYTSPSGNVLSLRTDLLLILAAIQAQQVGDTNLVEFLRPYLTSLSDAGSSIDTSVSGISGILDMTYGSVSTIASDLLSINGNVSSFLGALDQDRWRVHDAELQTALINALEHNGSSVDGISEGLGGISESASGASEYLSSINSQLDGFPKNWLTKSQLQDVLDHAQEPPHDEPSDDSAEKEQAARSAQYEWSQAESTSYSNKWELASWEYTKMLPGNASIVADNPSDNPGGTGFSPDDSGIPLFARLVEAQEFGMSIDSSVIEPGDYPIFMSYYNDFRVRWARIFHAVWDFIGAFSVFFIARREWKYYMCVGDTAPEVETDGGGIF